MEKTTHKLYTSNIGWNGTKRHVVSVYEKADGNFAGRPYTPCSDAFRWNGTQQPTYIKKEEPTAENVDCKKCLNNLSEQKVNA